ncbi:MAG: sigma-70 factor domain-containing protein, partial [Anaerolineae bacterium]
MGETKVQLPSLESLLEKASSQGYLTIDDILEVYPEAEEDLAQLEELFIYLQNHDIPVYGDEEEAEQEMRAQARGRHDDNGEEALEEELDLSDLPATDPISLYFHEMGRVPLLTPEEEQELAKTLERGRRAEKRLAKDGHDPVERERLLEEVRKGQEAREKLIRAN